MQALKAASASMTLIGRREDEAALRDAWRRLAGRPLPPGNEEVQTVAALLGIGWSDGFGDLIDVTGEEVRSGAPAPVVAARAAAAVMREDRQAEILAWWLADCALSWCMGWRHAVPILATQAHAPLLRSGFEGRRAPGSGGVRAGRVRRRGPWCVRSMSVGD